VLAERGRLLEALRPCFARTQVWLQAGKYLSALMSDLPERNGWSIARFCGDKTPDRTQRLLNHARWDTLAAMSVVRRSAVAGLDGAARRNRRQGGMRVGALDETGQEKHGIATTGVKRQYMGCAGRVANGINTVHLAYVREGTGHALIGARQWIPREHVTDPARARAAGLPPGLEFRTKGQLAADICADAHAEGITFDFICGDEVYGSSPDLREYLESRARAYVLRVASNFPVTLAGGTTATCAQAAKQLLKDKRSWEVRSAGQGSKGQRWYAWAWLATASPRHCLLIRRHLATGELAFHYCHVPEGQLLTKARLIRAAGLRWPAEESFEFAKDCFGLDQCQARLYTRDRPPHRAGHGRPGGLRRRRGQAPRPHQRPGAAAGLARPAAAGRPRPGPADRPGDQAHHRRAHRPAAARAAGHPLGRLDPPPPGTGTLVPPARTPQTRLCPGQLAKCGCRTSEAPPLTAEICGYPGCAAAG
jgi:SRSO17 transposase